MKNYVKPELFFESYELSQNIAACGWDMVKDDDGNTRFLGDPEWGNPQILVFNKSHDCETILESYCYENSADNIGMKIFQS